MGIICSLFFRSLDHILVYDSSWKEARYFRYPLLHVLWGMLWVEIEGMSWEYQGEFLSRRTIALEIITHTDSLLFSSRQSRCEKPEVKPSCSWEVLWASILFEMFLQIVDLRKGVRLSIGSQVSQCPICHAVVCTWESSHLKRNSPCGGWPNSML